MMKLLNILFVKIANQQKNIFELEEQCRRSELDAHSRICQYEAKLEQQAVSVFSWFLVQGVSQFFHVLRTLLIRK